MPSRDRDVWDKAWTDLMRRLVLDGPATIPTSAQLPTNPLEGVSPTFTTRDSCADRQAGGSARCHKLLDSFLERRCIGYQYNMSSPLSAVKACSRLSPHIAYGSVSLRDIYQQAKTTGNHRNTLPRKQKSLTSFRSRLHWHCHFIQKQRFGGNTYISPICDHEQAARSARKAVGDFRNTQVSSEETNRVLQRHGSRKGPVQKRPKVPARRDSQAQKQPSLFD